MAKSITVYTTATCGFCHMLKKFLDDNKFPYTEKRVDQDYTAAQEMIKKSGQMGVPFTVISDGKDSEQGILGFDVQQLQKALIS
ncbi:MAG TPA: glutaredoxin family protein [Candidatus Saccharibacteria bacterium]|nr:glutaredoxin family protein [Candidatus Saccharibacteria bacterium]MCB9817317.1 glutaredoxin family protein [Candidatus Nomurabacteria bacterium]HPR10472.1 glutaredoxin family protein [Candidatus Saccharibacteria bacterium]